MKKKLKQLTFSNQIRYFYVLIFWVVFLLCGMLYMITSYQYIKNSENNSLEYGLRVVSSNMEGLFKNVNDYSKLIAFDDRVQETLQNGNEIEYEGKKTIQETVIQMAACCDGISSIYLFDTTGESYIAGDINEIDAIRTYLNDAMIFQTALHNEIEEKSSAVIITEKSESEVESEHRIISYVRRVRDLDTLETLGLLVMNISEKRIMETFQAVAEQVGMEVAILDQNGKLIASTTDEIALDEIYAEEGVLDGKSSYIAKKIEKQNYRIGMLKGQENNWIIVGALSRSTALTSIQSYMLISAAILIIGMALCVSGANFITQRINVPLHNIVSSMGKVKVGILEQIPLIETNREMDDLQQHYNQMLKEIERLMEQKVEEQRLRRKYELSLLQAQIKPHFLYNTFDSVCALALAGRVQDVYTMMQALGQYYRNSLNKGQEIITIKEELNIVQNYLIIQSIRYEDVFEVVYDVDESVYSCKMIKLILQPFVENAIYHGFREYDLHGTITVRVKDFGEYVKIQVEDDGMGMKEEQLEQLMNRSDENVGKRFGLYGTMQRIQLYYHQEKKKLFEIKSELGEGTVITVWIPKEKDVENA